jgi:hypothetical protein
MLEFTSAWFAMCGYHRCLVRRVNIMELGRKGAKVELCVVGNEG